MSEFKKKVWNEQFNSVTDISHQNIRVIKEMFRIKKWFKPLHNSIIIISKSLNKMVILSINFLGGGQKTIGRAFFALSPPHPRWLRKLTLLPVPRSRNGGKKAVDRLHFCYSIAAPTFLINLLSSGFPKEKF